MKTIRVWALYVFFAAIVCGSLCLGSSVRAEWKTLRESQGNELDGTIQLDLNQSGIRGPWQVDANGHRGVLEFRASGGGVAGSLYGEELQEITFDSTSGTLCFLRSGPAQRYKGVLRNGVVEGTFDQGGSGSYKWKAWREGQPPPAFPPEVVDVFQEACVRSASNAFAVLFADDARKDVAAMEADAFEDVPKEELWSFFFQGALSTIRPMDDTHVQVLFFHPWSDAAVLTTWEYGEEEVRITRFAFVPAEFLRTKGALPVDIRPLWHRMSKDVVPMHAVQWAAVRTIEVFESLPPGVLMPDVAGAGSTDARVAQKTLAEAAAIQLGKSLEARNRLLEAPEFAGLRTEIDRCAEDLNRGLATCESPWCQLLDEETRKNFEPIKGHIDDFTPMGFLTDGSQSCMFMVCQSRPSLGVALLFDQSAQEVRFRKIGYLDFNAAYGIRDEIRSELPPDFAKEVGP